MIVKYFKYPLTAKIEKSILTYLLRRAFTT